MSNRRCRALILLSCMAILVFGPGPGTCLAASMKDSLNIQGVWAGNLKVSGASLKVIFKITLQADGSYKATLDVPDQGASKIPVTEVTLKDSTLVLKVDSIRASYTGTIRADDQIIEGDWKQGGFSFPLVLKKDPAALEVNRPQEPKKPYPYKEEEVVFQNQKARIRLAGTLTLPEKEGPTAAVVLISGSGPQDRDETVFNHRPFWIIADYLTRRNIAVLRFDDRGVGGSGGDHLKGTSRDFADDVMAAVDYLKARKEIDPNKIGLIGHSEGALIAGFAAAERPDISFMVLMAGPGVVGEELLYLQSSAIRAATGLNEKDVAQEQKVREKIFRIIIEEEDRAAARKKIREILFDLMAKTADKLEGTQKKEAMAAIEKNVEAQLEQLLAPWLRFFLSHDPGPTLMRVTCPILAITGEKDLQVPPKENLAAIEQALKKAEHPDFTIMELPGLNHLFQTAETGLISEYGKIEETFSPAALKIIGDWITDRTGTR
ncbi:MAG: alpha/beta hydrolase [Candidatus Adiutricales bacterium]